MKMYLNSQYHMDPPDHRTHRTVLCDNCTHATVDATTARLAGRASLLDRHRDVLIPARPGGGGSSPSGGPAVAAALRRLADGPALPLRPLTSSMIALITASSATLCSAMTVSSGCCSPDTSAASAHTGHHTCWHLPGRRRCPPPARRPVAPRGRAGPGWSAPAAAVQDRCRSASPRHAGHTSGFGRNRTVSSLPRSCASITMHRRRTDASRTRRRMPPAPMIKSSSTRPSVKAAESTCGNSSRIR